MQFKTNARVMGASYFNDSIEGQQHDFTTIHVEMGLDESTGRAKGFAGQSMKWGDASNFAKIKHLPFPFEAELTVELVTSGKVQKQRIVELRPLNATKAAA